jgi:hypothetical protein
MHPTYLPFSELDLLTHFAPVTGSEEERRHLQYYEASIKRLTDHEASPPTGPDARTATRRARQIEKDERFWVVAALMGAFHASDRVEALSRLLARALGPTPPAEGLPTWEAALEGELHLYFEPNLPSPPGYRHWLKDHLAERALIPYVRTAAGDVGERLEGPTHVDALIMSSKSRFAVLFEAKVLSDCDSKVFFDVMRDQLARNVDVMLDKNPKLEPPLRDRDPERTCFVLLTPEVFRKNPHSRLYGWLLPRYRDDPDALEQALEHRQAAAEASGKSVDWPAISRRLGWLTFEDCERAVPGSCRWLTDSVVPTD